MCGCSEDISDNVSQHNSINPHQKVKPENEFSFIELMIGDTFEEDVKDNNVITRVAWQKIRLSDAERSKFPALAASFDNINENYATEAKRLMEEFSVAATELSGDEFNPAFCQAEHKLYVQRADNLIVSVLEESYEHTGGVHPNFSWSAHNHDTLTGEKVLLTDIVANTTGLEVLLEKKLIEKYSDVSFDNLNDKFSNYSYEDYTWTIDYQGITFWFSPYDIAPYPVGTLSVRIWFDEYSDIFNKKYTEAPENYVISIPFTQDIDFDLSLEDNKKDLILTEKSLDKYGSYNMLSVTVNEKKYTDEINYAYDFDVYLVHMGNKNYIYSDSVSDNDYHQLGILDISEENIRASEPKYGTQFFKEYIEEGYETGTAYRHCFNNPNNFRLSTRFDILGTRDGIANYRISSKDGEPEMTDVCFNVESEFGLTSTIPLEVELLPEKTKTDVPAGTIFYPLRTDGKSYIDMKTNDGQEIRLKYDTSDYPHTINGVSEDECFENILYAG